MVEFAQSIPEDQRENWLTTQAASEEVTRLISSAIQSGELPVWVAPNDGDEKLVDPGAIIEMDHASVVSGVYRPPNDRGWLYGRPLFVKKTDWIEFVASVQAMKGAPKRWRKKKRRKTMSAGFAGILAARNGSCAEKP
ncbi:hypothetical protein [Alteriqipengyuania lutimaris]|uniref:hypothetical protein n=1 Tax=Alteriqipengyuania lutimaris TaxID=1538146 RepID=UPI0015F161BB|nr:hypothetical protein [Alteriqipengyuania lutimaris]MBB3032547.1 hypothetical protein [Alteriqipengyuania lutimaris]